MKMRCLAGLAVLVAASAVSADTIYVPAGGDIQKAINMASNGDVIQLEAGLYEPFATIDTIGRAVTIRGVPDEQGNSASIIDGQGKMSVIQCINGEQGDTRFERLHIRNGYANHGGGMYNFQSSPTILDTIFKGNTASGNGGGMANTAGSSPTLTNCTFESNTASDYGGGTYNNDNKPLFINCFFMDNSANIGGGMKNLYCVTTLHDCTFEGNSASAGGGMYNLYCQLSQTNCKFLGNVAKNDGGGMHNRGGNFGGAISSTSVVECTFESNTASGDGGGLFNLTLNASFIDCSFNSNFSGDAGGGIAHDGENITLEDCTLTNNTAGSIGGGIFVFEGSLAVLSETLICGNSPNQIYGTWQNNGDNTIATECDSCPDSDSDGVCDEFDQCPGEPDTDTDADGVLDCLDGCPTDPNKTEPGQCGCNEVDTGIAGDYDCDGDFDMDDYAAMGVALGVCPGDLNGDALVDGADLNILLGAWGVCP